MQKQTEAGNIACDECDEKFDHEEILKAIKERDHNGTNSPIPQVDGIDKFDISDVLKPTYCKICKECPEEMETIEDISNHVMNDHETNHVYEKYEKLRIEQRRYCIRRHSPFKLISLY